MIPKLRALLRQPNQLLGGLLIGLGLALLASAILGWNQPAASRQATKPDKTAKVGGTAPAQTMAATTAAPSQPAARSGQAPMTYGGQTSPSQPAAQAPTAKKATPKPPAPAAKSAKVSLTVNDKLKGSVTLTTKHNQCDVLQQALEDNLISSLHMVYNPGMESYGVFVIDGIGDKHQLNWVYKVNGVSPYLGCSHIKLQNGDAVAWKYVK